MTVSLVWFVGMRLAFDLVVRQPNDVTDAVTDPHFDVDQSTAASQVRTLKDTTIHWQRDDPGVDGIIGAVVYRSFQPFGNIGFSP